MEVTELDDVGSPDASGPSIRGRVSPSEQSPAVLRGGHDYGDDGEGSVDRSLVRTPSRKQKNLFMETQERLRKESTSDPNLKVRFCEGSRGARYGLGRRRLSPLA